MSLYLYSDGGGSPATQLGLLTSPASYSSVLSNTEFGGSGLLLSANNIYWLVASAIGGDFEWAYTYGLAGSGPGFLPAWAFTDDAGTAGSRRKTRRCRCVSRRARLYRNRPQ